MYFAAWSLSFYPQIYLNFKRKSVTGLNFDFLLLNVIGFSAYATYNLLMYYDPVVQNEYETKHPRSPIPVLLNDVVFAVHAFAACVVTAAQCLFLERANQRVSVTCMVLSALLILFAIGSGVATVLKFLTILQFVMCFSYIKMAVTLSKYFPQMYFNFRRKSTVGWSIGNVLLDFTGGTLDILQMVLQCINAADWVAFYGNPVKFGLGLVSIVFDVIFIFQHYVLYRGVEVVHADYEGIENPEAPQSSPPTNHGAINPPNQPIFDEEMR
ncbi:Lysosomal Cystine Transporter [Ancylostoma caninum]|uniref:Lysosomal Cystine Transporter n=1 Tax=Ancylostoma caninum TaxID=29170 RepID=A0A368GEH7_ANCCA|nr:Lysosomal Cystine Transporter [Ancylostoma caninum]